MELTYYQVLRGAAVPCHAITQHVDELELFAVSEPPSTILSP